ncbi:hypothetical protein [Secundilactobacillus kimchicus]|uniref:hypothetical protein n=1 Tax=Secundilactobacillus kimchicus TaxID=528209 RepID=UPI0024A92D7F|nr:hypothetical protein [Secundilactobacillus kimchicus]
MAVNKSSKTYSKNDLACAVYQKYGIQSTSFLHNRRKRYTEEEFQERLKFFSNVKKVFETEFLDDGVSEDE